MILKKSNLKLRLLALLLALVMVVGLVPVPAFANSNKAYEAFAHDDAGEYHHADPKEDPEEDPTGTFDAGETAPDGALDDDNQANTAPGKDETNGNTNGNTNEDTNEETNEDTAAENHDIPDTPTDIPTDTPTDIPAETPAETISIADAPAYDDNIDHIAANPYAETITVYISFEGYNLGHGFYVAPTAVTVPAGYSAAQATFALQDQLPHLGLRPQWVSANGTGASFFLHGILGFNRGFVSLPSYLEALVDTGVMDIQMEDAVEGGNLYDFNFTASSGWMITVNHDMIQVSAGAWELEDGDVIRWQFSLYGWGADLGLPNDWGGPSLYDHEDKTGLIRALFSPNAYPGAKQAALDVIINPLATAQQVAAAQYALLNDTGAFPLDKTELIAAIAAAEARTEAHYRPASWAALQAALAAAATVYHDTNATQAAVDAATNGLNAAIDALAPFPFQVTVLPEDIFPGTQVTLRIEGNLSPLQVNGVLSYQARFSTNIPGLANVQSSATSNLEQIRNITFTIPVGAAPGEYLLSNGRVDRSVFVAAQRPPQNSTHFQGDFPNIPITVQSPAVADKTELVAAIAAAEALTEADYTAESWAALQAALTAALAVEANTAATQDEVDTALAALTAAIDGLVLASIVIPAAPFRITAPAGAAVQLFRQGSFHSISPMDPQFAIDLRDGTQVVGFPAGGTHYRVSMAGKITRTGFTTTGDLTITFDDNEDPQTQVNQTANNALAQRMEASTMVNINARNHLTMDVGETFPLRGFRAAWEIVSSETENQIVQPDFHVNILYGSDVVSVTPVPNQSSLFTVTAAQPGTAVIEVYYDAIRNENRGVDSLFAATHPSRRSVIVVTVGEDTATVDFDGWDTEFDTVYYLNTQDGGYFPLIATSAIAHVEVAHIANSAIGEWQAVALGGGGYSIPVLAGNNMVRVTDNSGRVVYQVVRAAQITPVINNGQPVEPGRQFSVRFEGLFTPAPKMGNIYNPSLLNLTGTHGNLIAYSFNGNRTTGGAQYTFINSHTLHFQAPNAAGVFMMTNGNMPTSMWSFGSGFGIHRNLRHGGSNNGGYAPTYTRTASILPDIAVVVGNPQMVDLTELKALLETARELDLTHYRPATVGPLQQAMTGAEAVTANPDATELDVATALAALQAGINGLQPFPFTVTVTPADIFPGTQVTLSIEGSMDGISAQGATFQTRFSTTMPGRATITSSSAATANSAALRTITLTVPDSTAPGEYRVHNGFVQRTVVTSQQGRPPAVTSHFQGDFPNIYITVQSPVVVVDKGALVAAIAVAEGLTEADYTAESWAAVQTALAAALAVGADATQAEVDTAANALDAAINALAAAPVLDRTVLALSITAAEDRTQAHYTPTSWAAKQAVLTIARDIYAYVNATQPQIDTAAQNLNNALAALLRRANKADLSAAIAAAAGRVQANYTPASWAAKQTALATAQLVYENADATQNQVDGALAALQMAMDHLVYDITWQAAMLRGLDYIVAAAPALQFGTMGGEWAVLALARAGHPVPAGYFEAYLHHIGEHLTNVGVTTDPHSTQNAGGQFPLNRVFNPANGRYEVRLGNQAQSTENSRLVVALTALGQDASNFTHNGTTFDLVAQYGQRQNAASNQMWGEMQGINGPIWNLIALNARGWDTPYEIPDRAWVGGSTAANPITLDERIAWVLGVQLNNGGWNLSHTNANNATTANLASDPDMTAMALQALAPHRHMPAVAAAIDRALTELSRTQLANGGWGAFGSDNVQSPAQVIVALTALGIDPTADPRFVKAEGNPVTTMLRFFDLATGGFFHPHVSAGGRLNQMAAEQAVYSLVAYWRFVEDMSPLHNMEDAFVPPQDVVDKTVLNGVIAVAQGLSAADHTPASWTAVATALAHAISVRDNRDATQLEVNAATGALSTAINRLNLRPDFTALDELIARGTLRVQTNYTPASWQVFTDALNLAQGVRSNPSAAQFEVDNVFTNLGQAYDNLVPAGADPHTPTVLLLVYNPNAREGDPRFFLPGGVREIYIDLNPGDTAYSVLRRAEIGLNVRSAGHPTIPGRYVEAINHWGEFDGGPLSGWAYAVNRVFPAFSASLYTLQDGDVLTWLYTYEMIDDLIPEWGGFEGGAFGSVDRSRLVAAIERAERRVSGSYTAVSWAAFETALNAARAVRDTPAASQAQVNDGEAALNAAYNALVPVSQGGGGGGAWSADDWNNGDDAEDLPADTAPATEAALGEATTPDSETVADIVDSLLREAYEENADGVAITIPVAEGANTAEVEMIVGTLRATAAEGRSLTIDAAIGTITLDVATLEGLAQGRDDDEPVRITLAISENGSLIGSRRAITLAVNIGGDAVGVFRGVVTIAMPYVPSLPAADFDLLTVYQLNNLGSPVEVRGASFDGSHMVFAPGRAATFYVSRWISPFQDVSGDAWYFRSVRFVYGNNVMTGTAAGEFSPGVELSRAMMITMLWRLAGEPAANGGSFTDVAEGRWYTEAIAWAYENGIVSGYGDGTFGAADSITREQLALMLKNYSRFVGNDVSGSVFVSEFEDEGSVSHWALEAMMWANAAGLVNGRTADTLAPDSTATRAEAATIIQRFMEMA